MIKPSLSCYFSPPIQLGRKMAHGKPATPRLTSVCLEINSLKAQKSLPCPAPPSSPRAPPAQVFHLLPLLHLGEVVVGDLHPGPRRPSPPLVVAPSPVLLPIYSNPSHLPPPVHKNLPSKVGNVDPLRDLPVQAVGMDPSHSHIISHIGSVVVVI